MDHPLSTHSTEHGPTEHSSSLIKAWSYQKPICMMKSSSPVNETYERKKVKCSQLNRDLFFLEQLSAIGSPGLGWGWLFAIGVLVVSCLGIYAGISEKDLALKIVCTGIFVLYFWTFLYWHPVWMSAEECWYDTRTMFLSMTGPSTTVGEGFSWCPYSFSVSLQASWASAWSSC